MYTKKIKYILLIIALFLLIYNLMQTFLSIGIITDLFAFSAVFSYLVFLYFTNRTKRNKHFLVVFLMVSALVISSFTILYSPRYYYKQAQEIIISREYKDNKNACLINLKIKTIPLHKRLNLLIKKGYIVGLKLGGSKVYYFFNPVTGEYAKTDIINWV